MQFLVSVFSLAGEKAADRRVSKLSDTSSPHGWREAEESGGRCGSKSSLVSCSLGNEASLHCL